MDVSVQFSDLMAAFGRFFRAFTEVSFEYYGAEISVKSILIWAIVAAFLLKMIIEY